MSYIREHMQSMVVINHRAGQQNSKILSEHRFVFTFVSTNHIEVAQILPSIHMSVLYMWVCF